MRLEENIQELKSLVEELKEFRESISFSNIAFNTQYRELTKEEREKSSFLEGRIWYLLEEIREYPLKIIHRALEELKINDRDILIRIYYISK